MPQHSIELSVIIPAFNEELELQANVATVKSKLRSLNLSYEIILVNDGSLDQTLSKMNACADQHTHVLSYDKNKGKGFAVKHGMLASKGKYKLFMDVDLSTALDSVDIFLAQIRTGHFDILIGDRKTNVNQQTHKQPWYRRFLGNGFTLLSQLCIGRSIKDFTCGFKMFNTPAANIVFAKQRVYNWSFDTELLAIAMLNNLNIKEIPVIWNHSPNSAVRPIRNIFTSLSGLFEIKRNMLAGVYNEPKN